MIHARYTITSDGPATGLAADAASYGPWFHNLHLPDGTQTAPGHPLGDFPGFKWRQLATRLPADLGGWSVLDIGCNAGYYAIGGRRITRASVRCCVRRVSKSRHVRDTRFMCAHPSTAAADIQASRRDELFSATVRRKA
jgi:hypothetical protein